MARLECGDGGWLELTPYAYEFRRINDHWDDWLRIRWAASLPRGRKRLSFDPSFLTSEAHWLAEFFAEIGEGRSPEPFRATEPFVFRLVRWDGRDAVVFLKLNGIGLPNCRVRITKAAAKNFSETLALELAPFSERHAEG